MHAQYDCVSYSIFSTVVQMYFTECNTVYMHFAISHYVLNTRSLNSIDIRVLFYLGGHKYTFYSKLPTKLEALAPTVFAWTSMVVKFVEIEFY